MDNIQNEFYYKSILQKKISDFIEEITQDKNELGYISDNMVVNMTESAWLILKQNIDTNNYFKEQEMLK